jgi:hypothetical protein
MISNSFKRSSNKELTCKDTNAQGSSYQALAEGVEARKHGLHKSTQHSIPCNGSMPPRFWLSPNRGDRSMFARIASTTRLGGAIKGTLTPTTGCNGESISADGKLRHVFRHVMALRNRLGAYG